MELQHCTTLSYIKKRKNTEMKKIEEKNWAIRAVCIDMDTAPSLPQGESDIVDKVGGSK